MKNIVLIVVSMVILLYTPLAMARGNNTRATLNRMWKKEQARQEQINKRLDSIPQDIQKSLSRPSGMQALPRTGK